jgi:hypothetical protein
VAGGSLGTNQTLSPAGALQHRPLYAPVTLGRMTTVESPIQAGTPGAARARGAPRGWLVVAAAAAAAVVIGLGFQTWLQVAAPVARGSYGATFGNTRPCDGASFGDPTVTCHEASFAEGAPVGIGVAIRNEGPIPMTIVAIGSFGRGHSTTAILDPQILADEATFGFDAGRPFEPIVIEPGAERAVQLVGAFIGCEEAAATHMPGSSLVLTHLDLTVRWLIADQRVRLPLSDVLSLSAPDAGACG